MGEVTTIIVFYRYAVGKWNTKFLNSAPLLLICWWIIEIFIVFSFQADAIKNDDALACKDIVGLWGFFCSYSPHSW